MRIFSILFALVYSTLCLAQFETKTFTELLGKTLNSTFAEVIGEFPFMEKCHVIDGDVNTCVILSDDEDGDPEAPLYRYLKIDTIYTNIDQGRVKASLFSQTKPLESNINPATGLAEPIKIEAALLTDLTDTDDGRKRFSASASVDLTANTLSILKFVAKSFEENEDGENEDEEKKECEPIPIDDDTTNADHNKNILCFVLDGIRDASTVLDLQKDFQEAANYAKQVYGTDGETGSLIGDVFSSLKIEAQGSELVISFNIKTDSTLLTADNDEDKVDNLVANVALTIKETGLSLGASAEALFEVRQIDELREKINKIAAELAIRDSETHVKQYEDNLYTVFGLIEGFLVPVEEDEDDGFDDDDEFEEEE